jgi:AcrR family transcriptional regulator
MRSNSTKDRLLSAAGEVFAYAGYDKASIREICRLAKANVSAVSYHFGDKAGLYEQVVCRAMSGSTEMDRNVLDNLPVDPDEAILTIVKMFASHTPPRERPKWTRSIFMREMDAPRCQESKKFHELRHKIDSAVQSAVRRKMPLAVSDLQCSLIAGSIIGQCLFFFIKCHLIEDQVGKGADRTELVRRITDHIVGFSNAGMANIREEAR